MIAQFVIFMGTVTICFSGLLYTLWTLGTHFFLTLWVLPENSYFGPKPTQPQIQPFLATIMTHGH
jgi:hypothetical protein